MECIIIQLNIFCYIMVFIDVKKLIILLHGLISLQPNREFAPQTIKTLYPSLKVLILVRIQLKFHYISYNLSHMMLHLLFLFTMKVNLFPNGKNTIYVKQALQQLCSSIFNGQVLVCRISLCRLKKWLAEKRLHSSEAVQRKKTPSMKASQFHITEMVSNLEDRYNKYITLDGECVER